MMQQESGGTLVCRSPRGMVALGRKLGELVQAGDVIGLVGELGCGKTQFAKGVAAGMGVDVQSPVVSPTFTLINEHGGGAVPLLHMDLYRLHVAEDLAEIGVWDYLGRDGVCVIEWFDRFDVLQTVGHLLLRFRTTEQRVRQIELHAYGSRAAVLQARWLTRVSRVRIDMAKA